MSATLTASPVRTMQDVLHDLGDIPAYRVRMTPWPGTATVADLETPAGANCELVDGTLVEKAMGLLESYFAGYLIASLTTFVNDHNLGLVSGEAGYYQLLPRLVRGPDVAFASWSRFTDRKLPT